MVGVGVMSQLHDVVVEGGGVWAAADVEDVDEAGVVTGDGLELEDAFELSREGAQDAIERGQEEQRRLGRETAQRVGSQRARISAALVISSASKSCKTGPAAPDSSMLSSRLAMLRA